MSPCRFKESAMSPVTIFLIPSHMSLRPRKGRVALSILGVHTPLLTSKECRSSRRVWPLWRHGPSWFASVSHCPRPTAGKVYFIVRDVHQCQHTLNRFFVLECFQLSMVFLFLFHLNCSLWSAMKYSHTLYFIRANWLRSAQITTNFKTEPCNRSPLLCPNLPWYAYKYLVCMHLNSCT